MCFPHKHADNLGMLPGKLNRLILHGRSAGPCCWRSADKTGPQSDTASTRLTIGQEETAVGVKAEVLESGCERDGYSETWGGQQCHDSDSTCKQETQTESKSLHRGRSVVVTERCLDR
jgi:hypothetical protein